MAALQQLALSPSSRPEISIFGAKDWIIKHYTKLSDLFMNLKESGKLIIRQDVQLFHQHVIPLLHSSARALMYLTVAYQPDYYGIPVSHLAFLESSVEEVFRSIFTLRSSLSIGLMVDMFRIRNLFECIEMKSKAYKAANPVSYISDSRGMKIELRNVSFRYKEDSPHILKDVNFVVEPGQIVSIVGYNGSGDPCCLKTANIGKTTLIRLLALLEKPSSGDIYINDIKMSEYDPKVLLQNMSVLFQDFRNFWPRSRINFRKIYATQRTGKHRNW